MGKEIKRLQKILLIIIAFAVSFLSSYFILNSIENNKKIEDTVGDKLKYSSYAENIDGSYVGELYGDVFEGIGQFNFVSGEIYCGTWANSSMSGNGKMLFEDIGYYEGNYKDSKRSGKGTFVWDNGDKYEGNWKDDKMNGDGKYTFPNGNYIQGVFKDNKIDSGLYHIAVSKYPCEIYIKNSSLTNKIKFSYIGETYDGEIEDGKFNGQGTFTYRDGSKYVGHFKDNKRDGYGTYTWKSGEYYDGNWTNDKMSGKGTYYYKSKGQTPKLEGTFSNGVPIGKCEYYELSTVKYITTWENGKCVRVSEE